MSPKISIIMPVYNAEQRLFKTLRAVQSQTFTDYEIICIDDGSTDGSPQVLQCAAEDNVRIRILHQEHAGAGEARNRGLAVAKGEYVIFSDCDDLYSVMFLEKLYQTAISNQADIVACNFIGLDARNREVKQKGIHNEWLSRDCSVFSYRDCPVNILRMTGPIVWNKLYRKEFILQNKLKFDQLRTCNDLAFVAASVASAERIAYTTEHLVSYHFPRLNNPKQLSDVYAAVQSAVDQICRLPYGSELQDAIAKFIIENYLSALKRSVKDFADHCAAEFYQMVHETFNSGVFREIAPEKINNGDLYREFTTVKKHGYETMKKMLSRRLIVSLTSYPRRIGTVATALDTIYTQSRKADEVVLWLAEEQFPGKEADLPQNLTWLIEQGRLTVRWCPDLKPHKKYFYALQEFSEDIVVTIDDDLLYSKDMLETLYKSYLLYPHAVSTVRAHLIVVSEQKQILPYSTWIQETDACLHKPSMQLMATGGAGVLYPPNGMRKEFFDKEAIIANCPLADDLWLKAMQLVSDVPVVLARGFEELHYLPDTQDEALYQVNVRQNQNDVQLEQIIRWTDKTFWSGILVDKLTEIGKYTDILSIEAVSQHLDKERKNDRWKKLMAERKLKEAQGELNQTKVRLSEAETQRRRAEAEQEQLQSRRKQLERQLAQSEDRLIQTQTKLRQAEESKPIKRQLRDLGKFLREQKTHGHSSLTRWFKYLIYLLAWIPEILLGGMMFFLENGFKQTVKYAFRKIFKRG